MNLRYELLTLKTWPLLQALFGPKGACGGCWCMTWRLNNKEYQLQKGEGNKKSFHQLIKTGKPLGVLGFFEGKPVGWCSVSPRDSLVRMENSRLLKRIDQQPVWSISCLYLDKNFRRQGLATGLIKAARDYAFEQGAPVVEAYPMIPKKNNMPAVFAWVGFEKSFRKAGFQVVAKPSDTRLIMRCVG